MSTPRRSRLPLLFAAVGALVAAPATAGREAPPEAAFERRSYAAGEIAHLIVWSGNAQAVRIHHVAHGSAAYAKRDPLAGAAVTPWLGVGGGRRIAIPVGHWPSGLYVAHVRGSGGTGRAPFVVRPRRLGRSRIAVVLPTNTWAAYNARDVDGNGVGDTWYADPSVRSVDLARPFLEGGVPPHFRGYDRGFLRWLALRDEDVDVLADDDLEQVPTGDRLARVYDLIIFPGHEEYVTTHAYDIVERFRDLGGNLMFLSSNNFFYRVEKRGRLQHKLGRWRDLGRPEAALIGVQYVDWNHDRYPNQPYRIVGVHARAVVVRGNRLAQRRPPRALRDRDRCPHGAIAARHAGARQDRRCVGPGKSAEMTYYETAAGARVFAAGVINLGGSALWPDVRRLLDNLWVRLSSG